MYGRKLLPTCYTMRTTTLMHQAFIMTGWRFEGSNDLVNWVVLDVRYGHLHSHQAFSAICKPGGTTTWSIDVTKQKQLGSLGCSSFRLVQLDMNTGQTHSMSLAGFEVYGRPFNPELWTF